MKTVTVLVVSLTCIGQATLAVEGPRADSVLLNGTWEFAQGEGSAAEVPAAVGGGRLLFCQLDLRSRVLVSQSSYDPVAEQILMNVLSAEPAL